MKETIADSYVSQREEQQNQEHADYLRSVSERCASTTPSALRAERLAEELAEDKAKADAKANPTFEQKVAAVQQYLANLRSRFQNQNNPMFISKENFGETVTREMIADAEAAVRSYFPEQEERKLPTVAEAQAQYTKVDTEPVEKRQAVTPGPCPRCGQQLKNISVASHIDFSGDRCILDLKRTLQAGIITREQYNNLLLLEAEAVPQADGFSESPKPKSKK